MPLIITDSALNRITKLIQSENNQKLGLRVSVEGGGCSGFIYKYDLIDSTEIQPDDCIIEKNGVKLIIDPLSHTFLTNAVIDFVETLGSSYFEIKNPNAVTRCGCGNSFSV